MSRAGPALPMLGAVVLCCSVAHAQPSLWDTAQDPRWSATERALLEGEDRLLLAESAPESSSVRRRHLRLAQSALRSAAAGPDPRVRFLLASVLSDFGGERQPLLRVLLEQVLAEAPDAPQAAVAWYQLGLVAARAGDREAEIGSYNRALEMTWRSGPRANLLYNRGDARLSLGQLEAAIADFGAALRSASDPDLQALAAYGLGLARERLGDLPGALASMQQALRLQGTDPVVSVLVKPTVFFVPAYDLYYYQALEAMAVAAEEPDTGARRRALERAVAVWTRYLVEAALDQPPWMNNARQHLQACRRELEQISGRQVRHEEH